MTGLSTRSESWLPRMVHSLERFIPRRSFERRELGKVGERRALWFYRCRGYSIEERNLRTPAGEIDLVVRRGRTVVFVEVKTRQWVHKGEPFEAVDRIKQLQVAKLAGEYLNRGSRREMRVRFDVVSIYWTGRRFRLEHFPDAFVVMSDEHRPWRSK